MLKPSILLVPGSFVPSYLYQPILDSVSREGYEIRGLHLPSIGRSSLQGRESPAPTMYDDAEFIAEEAGKLADQGKDVVVIGHSYGGVPVSQSPKRLGKAERNAQGKTGGIVRLAYITSLVPAIGKSAKDVLDQVPKENQVHQAVDVSPLLPIL
jgi:predicted alpha/beta hydrolase